MEKLLLPFNKINKNGRIYTKESFADCKLPEQTLGEINPDYSKMDYYPVVDLSKAMVETKNLHIKEDGLYGDVEFLSHFRKIDAGLVHAGVKQNYVFRPRMSGNINASGLVSVKSIDAVDLLQEIDDSFNI